MSAIVVGRGVGWSYLDFGARYGVSQVECLFSVAVSHETGARLFRRHFFDFSEASALRLKYVSHAMSLTQLS